MLVATWGEDGRLTVDFVPKGTTSKGVAATETAAPAYEQVLPDATQVALLSADQDPVLRLARHDLGVLGLSSIQRHTWGE